MAVATTGFTGGPLSSPVTIDGQPVPLERETPTGIQSFNYFTEVTSLVKTKLDAAPAGAVSFTVAEPEPELTDGEILVVIYDDPAVLVDQTVSILYGALSPTGDTYGITLAEPVDLSNPDTHLEMSLGISYSCQNSCGTALQYSIVDVNGSRLSTSSGGEDDGATANGSLLTVGGEGDAVDNPADPNAEPVDPRSDDELYDLRPFVADGDTQITVQTSNPSLDDNVFLATFTMNPPVDLIDTGDGLNVTLSAAPGAVNAGEDVTWSALARNSGPDDAANASLVLELPESFDVHDIVGPADWTCALADTVASCTSALFADGAVAEFTATSTVPPSTAAGTATGTAAVASDAEDPQPEDNTAQASVAVSRSADVGVTLAGPATAKVGKPVSLDVSVTNNGPSTATDVMATLSTGEQIDAGDLAPGATFTGDVEVTFDKAGEVAVVVTAAGLETDPAPDNNTATLTIDVLRGGATLPPTGPSERAAGLGAAGLAALLAGGVLIVVARRRLQRD